MVWSILLQAVVSLLVFFIQQWWKGKHPAPPGEAQRAQFVALVHSKWRFALVPKAMRENAANTAFAQFRTNYLKSPPVVNLSDAPLSSGEALDLAEHYAASIA